MHDNGDPYRTVIHRLELEFTEYWDAETFGDEVFYDGQPPWDVGTVGVVNLDVVDADREFAAYVEYDAGPVIAKLRAGSATDDKVLVAVREATPVEPDVFALRVSTLTTSELESVRDQVASAKRRVLFLNVDPAKSD